MAKKYVDVDSLKFMLYQIHDLPKILKAKHFEEHDLESIDLFLNSVKDFSDQDLYPFLQAMDEKGAYFEDGKVHVHPQIEKVMRKGGELGLIGAPIDFDEGGLQLPLSVHTAAYYIMDAANNSVPGYIGLTLGAAELIVEFGNEHLKETYVPKMLAGDWGGTMCLTEPQAGSSLSDIITSATPQEDGSFKISGQKIFISGGDHEYVDNMVHLLLARIDGAPAGTKGISLFVVPKNRITESGDLEFNDVTTAGDFQKVGQKGYCTTHLMFGEKEDCKAWLVGEQNLGLKYMFLMMNGARIAVGRGAAGIIEAAYQASLQYAYERAQGRRLNKGGRKDLDEGQTLIIKHPDVRRMLMMQKSISDISLSLVLAAAKYRDLMETAEDPAEKERNNLLLEILTPIVKTLPSEMGITSISNGLQVLGGYGFCSEYILQQYYRDIRIFPIYEGTTGIQSLDLLARKIPMANGAAMKLLSKEIMETIEEAGQYDGLKKYGVQLAGQLKKVPVVLAHLSNFAKDGDFERSIADATIFMDYFGRIVGAWFSLELAVAAHQNILTDNKTYPTAMYEQKIQTMKYFFTYELPLCDGLLSILMNSEHITIPEKSSIFS